MPSGVMPTQILPEVNAPYNEGAYCGYRLYGPENSISEITAEWVVPKAISPTAPGTVLYHNPATQAQTPADFVSGMWIGIDSVPGKADTFIQAGTAQYLIATPLLSGHGVLGYNYVQSYALFMQVIPDTKNGATFLSNVLPVKAGDKVSVTIGYQKATKVATFRFINLTTNQTRIYNKTLPNGMLGKEADFVFEHNHFDGDPLAYLTQVGEAKMDYGWYAQAPAPGAKPLPPGSWGTSFSQSYADPRTAPETQGSSSSSEVDLITSGSVPNQKVFCIPKIVKGADPHQDAILFEQIDFDD
jgi:hypothetical protein